MLICPECRGELAYDAAGQAPVWDCGQCGGRVMSAAALQKQAGDVLARQAWQLAANGSNLGGTPCPMCSNYMTRVAVAREDGPLSLDMCTACRSAWLKPDALRRVLGGPASSRRPAEEPDSARDEAAAGSQASSAIPGVSSMAASATFNGAHAEPVLKQEQQERIAAFYAQTAANQMSSRYPQSQGAPDKWWQRLLGYIGMPVKYDDQELARIPIVTWSMAAAIVAFSFFALFLADMRACVKNLSFIPAEPFRHYGLTFITSFMLHGGLWHLFGNVYFLLVFGDNVEDRLGGTFFLLLVLVSALVGDVLYAALDPQAWIPSFGASGGVAGLLVFSGLSFPRAKFWCFMYIRWWKVPAWAYILFWVGMQVLGARAQIAGSVGVNYLAHLGGVLVGLVFWLVWTFGGEKNKKAHTAGA